MDEPTNTTDQPQQETESSSPDELQSATDKPLESSSKKPILEVHELSKKYGSHIALDKLSFEVYPGDIVGFLGPNGAGKTTTLRILATVMHPNSGSFSVSGHPSSDIGAIRSNIGYMPDFLGVYEDLLVHEYLEFFARAYELPSHQRATAIEDALFQTGLTSLKTRLVDGLSRGQKQRLGLARLLMHNPKLLLLDEPAAGLDPRARVEFKDILRGLQRKGTAIIVSSHILSDLSDFCTKILMIQDGIRLAYDEVNTLLNKVVTERSVEIRFVEQQEDVLRQELLELPSVLSAEWKGQSLVLNFEGEHQELAKILKTLTERDIPVYSFSEQPINLEDLYLKLTHAKSSLQ